MTGREFQQLVAGLLRRDCVVGVRATGLRDDLSMDVVGCTPDGFKVVVQCNRDAKHRRVGGSDVARFLGTVHDEHAPDIAVLVTTGRFTRSAIALGARRDVVLLDRSAVTAWMTGRATPLTPYLAATDIASARPV
jgi:restriction system protein